MAECHLGVQFDAGDHRVLVEVDEGDEVRLHSSAIVKLKKLVETPSAGGYGMHPKALRQVTPYFEAILDAPKAKQTDDE